MRVYFSLLGFLIITQSFGQAIIRCPNNVFARCVPTEESSLDNWTITDCDCNNVENIYTNKKVCKRTITLCSNNPTYPSVITAFNFPYFALNPITMKEMYGPNLQQLVSYMDGSGIIDPNLSADDQEVALLLEIDPTTGCVSFDAWVPLGEEHTIQVYTATNETGNQWRHITIPDNETCGQVRRSCYIFNSLPGSLTIPNGNGSAVFSGINIPLDGKLSDVRINNVNINHSDISDIRIELWSPFGTIVNLYDGFECNGGQNLSMGFEQTASGVFPCPPTNNFRYKPEGSFQDLLYDDSPLGFWNLRVFDPFNNGNAGSLNGWQIQLCIVEDICGPNVTSSDTPKAISSPSIRPITSIINISEPGIIEYVSIDNLNLEYSNVGSLIATLRSPSGHEEDIFLFKCAGKTFLNMRFDDGAHLNSIDCNNPFPFGRAQPQGSFANFIGQEVQGNWTLTLGEPFGAATNNSGELKSWRLNICTRCVSDYSSSSNSALIGTVPVTYNYQARNSIESTQRITGDFSPTSTATYQSAGSIQMNQNFEVSNGAIFEAEIRACNN